MSPDQVAGHIGAALAILKHLRDKGGLTEWDNQEAADEIWHNLNEADDRLRDAKGAASPESMT